MQPSNDEVRTDTATVDSGDISNDTTTASEQEAAATATTGTLSFHDDIDDDNNNNEGMNRVEQPQHIPANHRIYDSKVTKRLYETLRKKYGMKRMMATPSKMGHSMNWNIPTWMGTMLHITEQHGIDSWRYNAIEFLHQPSIQTTLMLLLFLDVLLLFTEFLLLAQFPHCSVIERDGISCCPYLVTNETIDLNHTNTSTIHMIRFLSSSNEMDDDNHNHNNNICSYGDANYDYPIGCSEHKWQGVHITEEVIFSLTMSILFTFFIELNVTMIALTPKVFFKQLFYTFDYIIVTTSIVLELTFYFLSDYVYQSLAGFLVFFRLWRLIRIGHGFIELTHNVAHHEYNELLLYTQQLEQLLHDHHINNIPLRPEHVLTQTDHQPAPPEHPTENH